MQGRVSKMLLDTPASCIAGQMMVITAGRLVSGLRRAGEHERGD